MEIFMKLTAMVKGIFVPKTIISFCQEFFFVCRVFWNMQLSFLLMVRISETIFQVVVSRIALIGFLNHFSFYIFEGSVHIVLFGLLRCGFSHSSFQLLSLCSVFTPGPTLRWLPTQHWQPPTQSWHHSFHSGKVSISNVFQTICIT